MVLVAAVLGTRGTRTLTNAHAEAKLKRQQEQRLARSEARKEKRHLKSEAKQARKANVGRAAKWNPERKALDKQKKLANRPHKQEKRRKRLRLRAEKLQAQAVKMMAEAEKAKARADLLDELAAVSPHSVPPPPQPMVSF